MAPLPEWLPSAFCKNQVDKENTFCDFPVVMMETDNYFHKTVTFLFKQQNLVFRTSQQLFSSNDIDTGTRFLLRTITDSGFHLPERILDLGCGYGPLGLTLKKLYSDSTVVMVDRDALALEYSRQNALINELEGVEIYGSLGYDDIQRDNFDIIVANVPGKVGKAVLANLLCEGKYYLESDGLMAIVVVNPLATTVDDVLKKNPGCEITLNTTQRGHTVFHYRFNDKKSEKPVGTALERGIYHRIDTQISLPVLEYSIQAAYGLPEFDSLSYASQMLIKYMGSLKGPDVRKAAVFNPGQGHIPIFIWKKCQPQNIWLVDRDLLALRYSRLNLINNGCPPGNIRLSHQMGLNTNEKEKVDLIVGVFREDEGKAAVLSSVRQAKDLLSPSGKILVAANSTAITRLLSKLDTVGDLIFKSRERWRGYSMILLGKK
jgi:16S rRNA (guanine1207-N2)-methyltransferase